MKRFLSLLAAVTLLACIDRMQPIAPPAAPPATPPTLEFVDGAHAGEAHFFFLPPIVPAPATTGTFDGTLAPVVEVCIFAGGACGSIVARFTTTDPVPASRITVDPVREQYQATWQSPSDKTVPTPTFRIRVLIGTREFGHADVYVARTAKELRGIDASQYVGLVRGQSLPIKFRFEQGIVGRVVLSPLTSELEIGQTQLLTPSVFDLHDAAMTCPVTVTWSSAAPAIAAVSSVGLVTAVSPGTALVTATCGTVSGFASIEVLAQHLTWASMASGTSQDLYGVSGTSATDVFISGDWGTILHYDGAAWTSMASPLNWHLWALWVNAPNDAWIVGPYAGVMRYDGTQWNVLPNATGWDNYAVWGASTSDVFVAGPAGVIARYTSAGGTMMTSPTPHYIAGLWGSSATDVFGVGDGGQVVHYDGSTWSFQRAYGSGSPLADVWGFAPNDVFAVGMDGTILHYDGSTWSSMTSGTLENLNDVWGASPTDVYAVGGNGTILHYDGLTWSPRPSGTTTTLTNVWGSSKRTVFVTGQYGLILRGTK